MTKKRRKRTVDAAAKPTTSGMSGTSKTSMAKNTDGPSTKTSNARLPGPLRVGAKLVIAFVAVLVAVVAFQVGTSVVTTTLYALVDDGTVDIEDAALILSAAWGGLCAGAMLLVPKTYRGLKWLCKAVFHLSQRIVQHGPRPQSKFSWKLRRETDDAERTSKRKRSRRRDDAMKKDETDGED